MTGHPQPVGPPTKACLYYGAGGTGDHPITFTVTAYADETNAHLAIQAFVDISSATGVALTRVKIGDEAIVYSTGRASTVRVRKGTKGMTLLVGNGASTSAMEAAAKTAISRL